MLLHFWVAQCMANFISAAMPLTSGDVTQLHLKLWMLREPANGSHKDTYDIWHPPKSASQGKCKTLMTCPCHSARNDSPFSSGFSPCSSSLLEMLWVNAMSVPCGEDIMADEEWCDGTPGSPRSASAPWLKTGSFSTSVCESHLQEIKWHIAPGTSPSFLRFEKQDQITKKVIFYLRCVLLVTYILSGMKIRSILFFPVIGLNTIRWM